MYFPATYTLSIVTSAIQQQDDGREVGLMLEC